MAIMIRDLRDLFERDLEIVYDSEHRLAKELPAIIEGVSSSELRRVFTHDLEQTKSHLTAINEVFTYLNRLPAEEVDHALKDIFKEAEKLIKNIDRSALLDAALIIFGNQVHHHKTALYGSLSGIARAVGFEQAADKLVQAMNEEKASSETLVKIAGNEVNPNAVNVQNSPHGWVII